MDKLGFGDLVGEGEDGAVAGPSGGVSTDLDGSGENAFNTSPEESRRLSIQRSIQSLVHSCQCRDDNCRLLSCHKMVKKMLIHTKRCKRKSNQNQDPGCHVCKQLIALCCYHAKHCQENKCPVPHCINIRHKLRQQQLQQRPQQTQILERRESVEHYLKDNYRRDSFSDRVCDDLCQHILQYLSLEDKLRVECVSKQFQRTVFLSECQQYLVIDFGNNGGKYFKILRKLLKKFKRLSRITFWPSDESISEDKLDLIIKYCDNISHIDLSELDLSDGKEFFDEFGHKLICVESSSFLVWNEAPNIEELSVYSMDSELSQIKFNRLKTLRLRVQTFAFGYISNIRFESLHSLNNLEVFLENNGKTLKHLEIYCRFFDNKSIELLLKVITKSTNLVHLSIQCPLSLFDKSLTNYWKEIAINCKQIKSIHILENDYNKELFSILKEFKQLKRLELKIGNKPLKDDFHPFQDLKGLEGLTHFSIGYYSQRMPTMFNETILTDIDINFPKLKSLSISCQLIATEWTAQVLNRISSLETIKLNITNDEIKTQIERQLIEKCRKFKSFEISYSKLSYNESRSFCRMRDDYFPQTNKQVSIINIPENSDTSEESDSSEDEFRYLQNLDIV